MTNEIKGGDSSNELSQDINVITSEINAYKQVAGNAIFEIGRRLKHVKENDLAHGEFGKWLESVAIHPRMAQQMMKVASDEALKTSTYSHLGLKALELIATMPESVREQPHTVPSTGETKSVDEMTVRELREVKRALKEAEQAKTQAETSAQAERKERERLEEENEELSDRLADIPEAKEPEVRYEKVTEYVEVKDESIEQRLLEYEERFGAIENYSGRVQATNISEVTTSVMTFSKAVRDLAKRHAYLIKYQQTLSALDGTTKQEYNEAVRALTDLARDFNEVSEDGAVIIDI